MSKARGRGSQIFKGKEVVNDEGEDDKSNDYDPNSTCHAPGFGTRRMRGLGKLIQFVIN